MTQTPDQHRPPLSPRAATAMALALGVASMVAATMLFGLFGVPAAEARLMQFFWMVLGLFGTVTGYVLLTECTPRRWDETALGRRIRVLVEWVAHVSHIVGLVIALSTGVGLVLADISERIGDVLFAPGAYLTLLPGAVLMLLARLEQMASHGSS